MTDQAATLLIFLFVGHFLGDFTPLATARMQEAKLSGTPIGPIALHALVHAVLVGVAVVAIARPVPMLILAAATVEFWTHLGLDWFRGKMSVRRPALGDPNQRVFWTVLGLDQLAHGLVLVGIAFLALM
ncbi:MAG: DUF3307 domain-containing protein [Gemmatimonadota bacterium]|jgi:hypothetical protein